AGQQDGQRGGDRLRGGQQAAGRLDGEVRHRGGGDAVGGEQQLVRLLVGGADHVRGRGAQQDALHRVGVAAGEVVAGGGDRHHRQVVAVLEGAAAAGGEHADHGER